MRKSNFQKNQFISIVIVITFIFSVFGSAKAAPALTTPSRLYWNTFLGGPGYDQGAEIVADSDGYVYVVGTNSGYCIGSCTFTDPTWGSPLNPYAGGEGDGFITKLSPNGSLIWNTFLGGSDRDVIQDIVLDENGNIYVAGAIYNNTGSLIQFQDGFVAKLNSSGELIWNVLLDGALTRIDLDEDGNIFVIGASEGNWNIVDAPLNSHSGDDDIFVVKLTSSGDFSWYTFLGGTARDGAGEIIVSDNGNINIVGTSEGTWGNPIRAFIGDSSAFVAELNSSGALLWNTFLGGGRTSGADIDVDDSGNVYVVGTSLNTWGNPIRAFENPFPFPFNGYTAKLDTNGSLVWNTFLGNGSNESYAVDIDDDGYLYIVGSSCSSWGNPFNSISNCPDGDIVKLENTGDLIKNGYFGGEGTDYSVSLFLQDSQNIFVMGFSEKTWGNPIRPTHYENAPYDSSPTNVFVAKLNLDTTAPTVNTINRVGTNPSNMLNVSYLVTFSENVTGVDVTDFTLNTTGVAGAFISNVSGIGNTRVISVNTGQGSTGTIRLDFIDDDTVTDLAGNPTTNGHLGDETYTIQKAILLAPILRSPRSNATLNDTTPNLVWQIVAKATQYEIQIANDENFTVSLLTDTTNNTTYTLSALLDGTYYWRVQAIDVSGGAGKWSQPRIFTIDTVGPAAPTLISPSGTLSTRTVKFLWNAVSDATRYQLVYDNDVDCRSPIRTSTIQSTSTRMTLPSGTYYWCVRAKDAVGNWGAWSTPSQITIP
jgi:hypothetical protein